MESTTEGSWFERDVAAAYPDLERLPKSSNANVRERYRGIIVPGRFGRRCVEITILRRGDPIVCVDGPAEGLPHRYHSPESVCAPLCMWYPHDPPHARWTWNDGLLALLGHIRTHLIREGFYLEDLRLTGHAEWLGPEAPHE